MVNRGILHFNRDGSLPYSTSFIWEDIKQYKKIIPMFLIVILTRLSCTVWVSQFVILTQKKSSVRRTGNPTDRLTRGNFATNSLKAFISEILYSAGEVKHCLWYFMRMQDCAPFYLIPDIISMERNIYKNLRFLMELRTWLRLPTWENIVRNIKKILKAVLWLLQSPLKWFRMRHQGLEKILHDISSYSDQLAVLHSRMNYQLKNW